MAALRTPRKLTAVHAAVVARLHPSGANGEREGDAGMTTAEYAVGTVAACGFGGVLYKVVTSEPVLEVFKQVILKAFKLGL